MSKKENTTIVILYMAFAFLSNFATIMYFLTLYLTSAGFSVASISIGILVYQISKLILEIPSGLLSDRFGHRFVGLCGLACMAAYYVLLIVVQGFPLMIVAFLCKGIGVSCLSGSFEALYIAEVNPQKLVRYNAIENAITCVAFGVATLLGGLLAQTSLFVVGLVIDLVFVVASIGIGLRFPASDGSQSHTTVSTAQEEQGNAQKSNKLPIEQPIEKANFIGLMRHLKDNPLLLSLLAMDFSQALLFVGFEDFYSVVLSQQGLDSLWSGVSLAVECLIYSLVVLAVPRFIEKTDKRKTMLGSYIGRFCCMCLFFIPGMPVFLIPLCYITQSIFSAFSGPIRRMIFQRSLPEGYRAAVLSAQSQAIAIGAICFSGLNALLSTYIGVQGVLILMLIVGFGLLYGVAIRYVVVHAPQEIVE